MPIGPLNVMMSTNFESERQQAKLFEGKTQLLGSTYATYTIKKWLICCNFEIENVYMLQFWIKK